MRDSRVDTARERASIGAADGGQHGRKTFLARFARLDRFGGFWVWTVPKSFLLVPTTSNYLFIHAIVLKLLVPSLSSHANR